MTNHMNRRRFLQAMGMGAAGAALAACAPAGIPSAAPAAGTGAAADAAGTGQLEIFSWWTTGGEVEALEALYEVYRAQYPGVEIENAALAGGTGQGGNMKALLETRMMGGEPPDSFQVHLGRELIDSHVIADRMEPVDSIYEEEGFLDIFPRDLIDIASHNGSIWSVPVNIHRSNVLWYRTDQFDRIGAQAPTTWDEFFETAEALQAAGITPFVTWGVDPNNFGHILEGILASIYDQESYNGLFNGSVGWDDDGVTQGLEILNRIIDYTVPDFLSIASGDVWDRFVGEDGPAMVINGDWANGVFKSRGFTDFRWAPTPGTEGIFVVLSDSFGLPKGAPNRENAINFLRVVGSKEGQDAFNPPKGSIPARNDADTSLYDEYQLSAMEDFGSNTLYPSLQHGAAAKQSFLLDYDLALNTLMAGRDVAGTQEQLVQAAEDAQFGQ